MINMGNWQGSQNPRLQYETGPIPRNGEARALDRQAIIEERRKERIKNALLTQLGPNVSSLMVHDVVLECH